MKRIIISIIALAWITIFIIMGFAYKKGISNSSYNTTADSVAATTAGTADIATIAVTAETSSGASEISFNTDKREAMTVESRVHPQVISSALETTASSITIMPTIKSGATENTENKLTLIKSSDKSFNIYEDLDSNGMQLITFDKKNWGTWNIGNWYYCKHKSFSLTDYEQVAGGAGTDWEYVFRAGQDPTHALGFSGGNHGKELLRGIKFVFDNDEKELDELKIGERKQVNSLVIDEDTSLMLDEGLKNKYADVNRIYTILPSKITLETHFDFTSDIYMGTSYVCMFPISKDEGRFIKFNDSGNIFETPALGETLTTGGFENYIGKEKTLSVQIWGDAKPNYKFNVKIDNEEMADNFNNQLKVFYWDLNKFSNKLYFSKFDSENPQMIPSGTEWDNKAEWEFEVDK